MTFEMPVRPMQPVDDGVPHVRPPLPPTAVSAGITVPGLVVAVFGMVYGAPERFTSAALAALAAVHVAQRQRQYK